MEAIRFVVSKMAGILIWVSGFDSEVQKLDWFERSASWSQADTSLRIFEGAIGWESKRKSLHVDRVRIDGITGHWLLFSYHSTRSS